MPAHILCFLTAVYFLVNFFFKKLTVMIKVLNFHFEKNNKQTSSLNSAKIESMKI